MSFFVTGEWANLPKCVLKSENKRMSLVVQRVSIHPPASAGDRGLIPSGRVPHAAVGQLLSAGSATREAALTRSPASAVKNSPCSL